jgi:hypothetical protein
MYKYGGTNIIITGPQQPLVTEVVRYLLTAMAALTSPSSILWAPNNMLVIEVVEYL